MKKSVKYILVFLYFLFTEIHAQNLEIIFQPHEKKLQSLAYQVLNGKTDIEKRKSNTELINELETTLKLENSFKFPFDSLKSIAVLNAPDNRFKIFNWNLPLSDGTFEYYAFLQVYNKSTKKFDLIKLVDKSDEIQKPETKTLTNENWYGALYYKVILTKWSRKKYYTFLGWDGNNNQTNKKVIEVMTLSPNGKPRFGQTIFAGDKLQHNRRYFFEYKEDVTMSLKYEEQYIITRKTLDKKNSYRVNQNPNPRTFDAIQRDKTAKERIKRRKMKMIVFDRLAPLDANLKGVYSFYVTETNIYDAFVFKSGKWRFFEDVDARNFQLKSDKPANRKPVKYDLAPKKEQNNE